MWLPDGFRCGHWTAPDATTGCTVVVAPPGSVGAGEVRGGGPATHESDLLSPLTSTPGPEAILLTGGSAHGLAGVTEVAEWLLEQGRGFPTPAGPVPLVSAAALYDLHVNQWARPIDSSRSAEPNTGSQSTAPVNHWARPIDSRGACAAAGPSVERGRVGAGAGATAGKVAGPGVRTGIGAASLTAGAATVVAIAAPNPIGDIVGADGRILAGGPRPAVDLLREGAAAPIERTNTTLVVVCTDARLTKLEAHLVARAMTAGVARAVNPSATTFDGDFTACLASGTQPADPGVVAVVAAEVTTAAIRDAAT